MWRLGWISVGSSIVFSTDLDAPSISNDVSIRIFGKRLRIHDFTIILVEGAKEIRRENNAGDNRNQSCAATGGWNIITYGSVLVKKDKPISTT